MVGASRYRTTEERALPERRSCVRSQRVEAMDRCWLSFSSQWWMSPNVYPVGTACRTIANCGGGVVWEGGGCGARCLPLPFLEFPRRRWRLRLVGGVGGVSSSSFSYSLISSYSGDAWLRVAARGARCSPFVAVGRDGGRAIVWVETVLTLLRVGYAAEGGDCEAASEYVGALLGMGAWWVVGDGGGSEGLGGCVGGGWGGKGG